MTRVGLGKTLLLSLVLAIPAFLLSAFGLGVVAYLIKQSDLSDLFDLFKLGWPTRFAWLDFQEWAMTNSGRFSYWTSILVNALICFKLIRWRQRSKASPSHRTQLIFRCLIASVLVHAPLVGLGFLLPEDRMDITCEDANDCD